MSIEVTDPKPLPINLLKMLADARRARGGAPLTAFPNVSSLQQSIVKAEISKLNQELQDQLAKASAKSSKAEAAVTEWEQKYSELEKKYELDFLLSRVTPKSHEALLQSPTLMDKFFNTAESTAFVMSVDIRRSTELMLKARKPELFARFIGTLCSKLEDIIKEQSGVFDKFTGDGILAFFPEHFSGKDNGYRALSASRACHKLFEDTYREYRSSFSTIMADVGLGIGIDFGPVHFLKVASGLTVVGSPVVYACRLSGAPAGHTYLNQPAYEIIADQHGGHFSITEAKLNIKHEGDIICYDAALTKNSYKAQPSAWEELANSQATPEKSADATKTRK